MKNFKRAMVLGMVAVGMISLIGCGQKEEIVTDNAPQEITAEETKEDAVEMANPFEDVGSLEEASKKAGFNMVAPESIDGYEGVQIQVIYGTPEHSVYLRKSCDEGDISGDYNEYPNVEEKEVNGHNVTIKGQDDMVYVVYWSDGTYSYSIQSNDGFEFSVADGLLEVVE